MKKKGKNSNCKKKDLDSLNRRLKPLKKVYLKITRQILKKEDKLLKNY